MSAHIFHLMKKVDEMYGCKERTDHAQNNVAHIQHALKYKMVNNSINF